MRLSLNTVHTHWKMSENAAHGWLVGTKVSMMPLTHAHASTQLATHNAHFSSPASSSSSSAILSWQITLYDVSPHRHVRLDDMDSDVMLIDCWRDTM